MVLTGGQAGRVSRWNEYGGRFGSGAMWMRVDVDCRVLAGCVISLAVSWMLTVRKFLLTSSRGWESSLRFLQINTQVSDCARSSSDQRRLY